MKNKYNMQLVKINEADISLTAENHLINLFDEEPLSPIFEEMFRMKTSFVKPEDSCKESVLKEFRIKDEDNTVVICNGYWIRKCEYDKIKELQNEVDGQYFHFGYICGRSHYLYGVAETRGMSSANLFSGYSIWVEINHEPTRLQKIERKLSEAFKNKRLANDSQLLATNYENNFYKNMDELKSLLEKNY